MQGIHSEVIRYSDIDGNPAEAEYHFSLSISDLAEMEIFNRNDVEEFLDSIVKTKDNIKLIAVYKEMLLKSVGRRVGKRMVKNQEVLDEFVQTGAYEAMFMNILTNGDGGESFFKAVFPPDLVEKASQVQENRNREYTDDELLNLSQAEFDRVAGTDLKVMSRRHLMIAMRRKNAA